MNSSAGNLVRVLAIGMVAVTGWSACSLSDEKPEENAAISDTVGGQVTIRTDKEVYAAGGDILVTIENGSDSSIYYYGGCSIHLCQQAEGHWLCEMKECDAQTVELEAGSLVEMVFQRTGPVNTRLKYRFDYITVSEDDLYTVDSNEFTIGQGSGFTRLPSPLPEQD